MESTGCRKTYVSVNVDVDQIGSSINAAPPLKRWAVWNTIHCADLWKGVLSVSGRKQVVCGSKGKQELNGLKAKENSIKDMI